MAKIIMVSGGCRSGKSGHAQKYCEGIEGKKLFLATAPVHNEEMKMRVEKHRAKRDSDIWETVEEEFNLAEVFSSSKHDVILIDCITFWIDNILYRSPAIKEEDMAPFLEKTFFALDKFNGTAVFVTNEIGFGTLPEDPRTRKFRDLVGLANAMIAKRASNVVLFVSGIPMFLKGTELSADNFSNHF